MQGSWLFLKFYIFSVCSVISVVKFFFSISQPGNPDAIVDKGAGKENAVHAVQEPAVSRDEGSGILYLGAPLQDRFPKVSKLPDDAHAKAENRRVKQGELREKEPFE
jgi:hypothetical protein